MEKTKKQFDILVAMAEAKDALTQRELEKATGHSLGTINRVVKELTEAGYLREDRPEETENSFRPTEPMEELPYGA